MKAVFARFGIPDIFVTDNGPQFPSSEFSVFTRTWEFKHVTSSPTYAQPTPPASEENNPEKEGPPITELRRFGRTRQAPVWHKDYDIRV